MSDYDLCSHISCIHGCLDVMFIHVCNFCRPGVVHHISRLSIQDRVLDLSVKKDNGSLCSQSVDRSASTSAPSASLSVRRTDVPDKPSSPLPHLYVTLRLVFVVLYTCDI